MKQAILMLIVWVVTKIGQQNQKEYFHIYILLMWVQCQNAKQRVKQIILDTLVTHYKKRGEIQKGAWGTLFDSFYKKLLPLSHTESKKWHRYDQPINRDFWFSILAWGNQIQAVLDLSFIPPPYLSPWVLGAFPSLLGWVQDNIRKNFFLCQKFLPTPRPLWGQRGPPQGQKFLMKIDRKFNIW